MIKSFIEIARIGFKLKFIYKSNYILAIFKAFIELVVPLIVWQALYASSESGVVNGKTVQDMLTYVLISRVCMSLMCSDFAESIEQKMKTGLIGYNFVRPQPARMIFVGESLGKSFYSFLSVILPIVVATAFLWNNITFIKSPLNILFFVISMILGSIISILFELLKGTFAFWFVNVFIINWFLDIFYVLLSGAYVPLWFFPEWLRQIATVLPFRAAYFVPVEIYLAPTDPLYCIKLLLIQVIWIVILCTLQEIMWRKSVQKLVVLGG